MASYSVIGLGKLGASMVAAIASRGYPVIGVDVVPAAIERLARGEAPVHETNLEATIRANRERIVATASHEEAVLGSDTTFVVVPTPSDERGAFVLSYARDAFAAIGRALRKKPGYHNVVMTSTVLPGATRHALLPLLERESGKRCGPDFGLCYSPEFIALGSVIRDFLNPDFVLLGEVDARAGESLVASYAEILENGAPCQRMSLENAELAKLCVNSYVTTKIAFANMLADLCERLPGGDVDVVSDALGLDKRIGRRYLTGGLGFGGPCFPRDNVALSFLARELGTTAQIAEGTSAANHAIVGRVVKNLTPRVREGVKVAVLGLAYKPASHILEESQSLLIAQALAATGAKVTAYDPLAIEMPRRLIGEQIRLAPSAEACIADADVILVTTSEKEFRALRVEATAAAQKRVTVVDFWRLLPAAFAEHPNVEYMAIGRGLDDEGSTARLAALWREP